MSTQLNRLPSQLQAEREGAPRAAAAKEEGGSQRTGNRHRKSSLRSCEKQDHCEPGKHILTAASQVWHPGPRACTIVAYCNVALVRAWDGQQLSVTAKTRKGGTQPFRRAAPYHPRDDGQRHNSGSPWTQETVQAFSAPGQGFARNHHARMASGAFKVGLL